MKKHLPFLLTTAACFLTCSFALADTTQAKKSAPPVVDVTSAASAVPLALNTMNLSDEDVLGIASPVRTSALSIRALGMTALTEVEGPETEGPDDDGPGGPDHEFEGEETGNH